MGDRNRIFTFKPEELMSPGNSSYDAMNHWLPQIYRKPPVEFKNKINPPDSKGRLNRLPPLTNTSENSNGLLDFGYFGKPSQNRRDPGLPRMRTGRIGSSWRNITQVLGNRGNQVLFIDGSVKTSDNIRFPWAMGEFGPMESESSASYVAPRLFSSDQFAYPSAPINYDFEPDGVQAGNGFGETNGSFGPTDVAAGVDAIGGGVGNIAPEIHHPPAMRDEAHNPTPDPQLDTTTSPPIQMEPISRDQSWDHESSVDNS